MFVAPDLAARIDRVEARLSLAIATAAQLADPALSVHITEICGGAAVLLRPGSPINKLIGLGFTGPLDLEILQTIESTWHARGESVRVELSSLADPGVAEQLSARGYRLRGFEHVLVRPLTPGDADREIPGIDLSEDDPAWLRTVVDGFASPDGSAVAIDTLGRDALDAVMRDFVAAPGFRRYTARIASLGGTIVGAAAMRIDDGIALLCGASTLPPARRRGVQAALLAARLRDASRAGCEFAVVTTEPGSLSQRNVARHGFELAHVRAILTLPTA
jgi:GNAT superfamily N-acetyltransferase